MRIIHDEIKANREIIDAFARGDGDARTRPKEILLLLEQAVQRACAKIHEKVKAYASKT